MDIILPEWLAPLQPYASPLVRSLVIIGFGLLLGLLIRLLVIRPLGDRLSAQSKLVARKAVAYSLWVIVTVMILREFGFQPTALLGAAGIAGVAIGFAAQTSLSNIISGIFLVFEKPFEVGDVIRLGEHTGFVESIGLLSLTLRTFDNISIRIPNESLVKGTVINVTRHPIRRHDIELHLAFREDIDRVLRVLREVADDNPHVLVEPEPLVSVLGFGDCGIRFLLGVWHEREDFVEMRTTILRDLKLRLDREGIALAYPHRMIIQDSAPLPLTSPSEPAPPTAPTRPA
jgi:small-conductance mechanosensitive channel